MRRVTHLMVAGARALAAPPLVYGLCYLLLIPIFAVLFALAPDAFAQTTSKYEPAAAVIRNTARLQLIDFINHCLRPDLARTLDLGSNPVISIEATAGSVTAIAWESWQQKARPAPDQRHQVSPMNERHSAVEWTFRLPPLSASVDRAMVVVSITHLPNWVVLEASRTHLETGNEINLGAVRGYFEGVRPGDDPDGESAEINGSVLMPEDTLQALQRLSALETGQPLKMSLGILRFVYLSAVTITTLGYGDIVPVTNVARTLISIEAICGLILIGLFLNSVAKRAGQAASR